MPSAENFEAPQGNPLFEVQFRAITESLAGNGILSNGDLEVTAGSGALEIDVASGTVYYVASEYSYGGASPEATLSGGDANDDRWDTVAFDTATTSITVREGTAGATPTPPDIQGGELLLAIIHVPAGATDISNSNILNWRAKFSNEAEEVHYDDGSGVYSTDNVDAALDELQEAAQISAYPLDIATDTEASAYPLAIADLNNPFGLPVITDMDVASTDLVDGGATLYEQTNGWFRNEVIQALANFTSDEQFGGYPLGDADLDMAAVVVEDPERQFIARLDNTESIEIPVRVPDGDTLEVYRWGAFDASDGSAPAGLVMELLDGSDTVQASENTANNQSKTTAVASHANSSGSASIFKVRANNGTGSAINSPGVGMVAGFVVV